MGRPAIFQNKTDGRRVQGIISKAAGKRFEYRRLELSHLVADATGTLPKLSAISDADVIEYLARGENDTIKYLREAHGKSASR